MSTQALFTPAKLGKANLKHRVVLAPLTRFRATTEGVPTDLVTEYYKQRATDGGLLISEATFITRLSGCYKQAPGIYTKEQIGAWKKVTTAVHEKKSIIFMQLWHIGRAGSKNLNPNGEQVVSASDIAINGFNFLNGTDYEKPRALEIDEIKSIVQDYRQAALNAIEAGFDGVEIHSANGYLIDQFLNPASNKRTDAYGGSVENRSHFALEVVAAIADAIGPERTAIRFSPGTSYQDMDIENEVENYGYVVAELYKRYPNLAYLHLIQKRTNILDENSSSTIDSLEPYRKLWKGTLVSASGYSKVPEFAAELAEKTGDLIAFGRTFIANPDLPERLRNGWELSPYNRDTFYTHEAAGYTDYPTYSKK
ncbi:MAG: hypothetical protein EXX96DRAFT_601866 [Benjaminiella poitrasii]|nr:MAG: hypothetical protein EXX96DRAFT_601866 [Benjaminiella poitrasii]